jgi:hypothetical protein
MLCIEVGVTAIFCTCVKFEGHLIEHPGWACCSSLFCVLCCWRSILPHAALR